ncbi:MAG: acylphosphatase [Treponema sp.]|nr:acylphosphatase [Treponema sp.]
MKIRRHYIFSGMVQGVGFRWRSEQIAKMLGITGWVRNRLDGRVEMEAQAEEEALEKMLNLLERQSFIQIDGIESSDIPVETQSYYFSVKH